MDNGFVTERWRMESNKLKEDFLFGVSAVLLVVSELDKVRAGDVFRVDNFGDEVRWCVGDNESGDLPDRSDMDFLIWLRDDVGRVGMNKDMDESCLEKKTNEVNFYWEENE